MIWISSCTLALLRGCGRRAACPQLKVLFKLSFIQMLLFICCVNFLWPKTQFMFLWVFAWAVPWLFWVSNWSWSLSGVTCLGFVMSVPGSLGAFVIFLLGSIKHWENLCEATPKGSQRGRAAVAATVWPNLLSSAAALQVLQAQIRDTAISLPRDLVSFSP